MSLCDSPLISSERSPGGSQEGTGRLIRAESGQRRSGSSRRPALAVPGRECWNRDRHCAPDNGSTGCPRRAPPLLQSALIHMDASRAGRHLAWRQQLGSTYSEGPQRARCRGVAHGKRLARPAAGCSDACAPIVTFRGYSREMRHAAEGLGPTRAADADRGTKGGHPVNTRYRIHPAKPRWGR